MKRENIQLITPPPCSTRHEEQSYQIKTEEFFEDFDNNFIIKFDESPEKGMTAEFSKVSDSN